MSGADLVVFDDVSVPEPLSVRVLHRPFGSVLRVIVDGPPGAVELQIRPRPPGSLASGMSIEYHSRRPRFGAESSLPHCEVLHGVDCYADGMRLGDQSVFEDWLRARDGQAIVDELVRRHQVITWTLDDRDEDTSLALDARQETTRQPPAGEARP